MRMSKEEVYILRSLLLLLPVFGKMITLLQGQGRLGNVIRRSLAMKALFREIQCARLAVEESALPGTEGNVAAK